MRIISAFFCFYCLHLAPSLAQSSVSNDYFVVNLDGVSSWGKYSSASQVEAIKADVQRVINYWGDLLGDNHRPLTGDYPTLPGFEVPPWERRVVIDISFAGVGSVASAATSLIDYVNLPDSDFAPLTAGNGNTYTHLSRAEAKLKSGYNIPISLISDDTHDMSIVFSSAYDFSLGNTVDGGAFDFETIFLHEMTHGMGFETKSYGNDGYTGDGSTALDASMKNPGATPGEELIVSTKNEKGEIVEVATLRNPSGPFNASQDIVHIDDLSAVMYDTINPGEVKNEFTMTDLAVLEAMGWDLTYADITDPTLPPASVLVEDSVDREFLTQGGLDSHTTFTLTGLKVEDGLINNSLTLNLDMTKEQLSKFDSALMKGGIIGFELEGIFDLDGIQYHDVTLIINGKSYSVLGASTVKDLDGMGNHVLFFIPEPSSVLLGILALAGSMARRRRHV